MADKEDLVKYIADTLRKEIVIDAPPQRVISSSSFRKTRSRPPKKAESNNIILLLDSNNWADITDINTTTAKTKYKGNIDFYTGIIKQSKAYKTKRIYTFSSEGTLFGHPFYGSPYFIQDSVLLNQYVFSPLGIEVIIIKDTDINQVDSVIWIPLLTTTEEVYLDSSPVPYFLPLPLRLSEESIFLLTKKAKDFGLILQGEHTSWYDHNNYYLENFNKKNKSDWRFLRISYSQNWVSQCSPGKGSTIVTAQTHGMPVSQLDQRMRALATFEWEGVEYAGAIAWRI